MTIARSEATRRGRSGREQSPARSTEPVESRLASSPRTGGRSVPAVRQSPAIDFTVELNREPHSHSLLPRSGIDLVDDGDLRSSMVLAAATALIDTCYSKAACQQSMEIKRASTANGRASSHAENAARRCGRSSPPELRHGRVEASCSAAANPPGARAWSLRQLLLCSALSAGSALSGFDFLSALLRGSPVKNWLPSAKLPLKCGAPDKASAKR